MSKLKSPREKKIASLMHDRRNDYGENDKSSRKNIPKSKQRSHQAERRAATQPLNRLVGVVDDDAATEAELQSHTVAKKQRLAGFKKMPDAPLGEFIKNQAYWANRRNSKTGPDYISPGPAARRPADSPDV